MPAAAQRMLLARLVEQGARLAYHGDFDWPGLRIAAVVMRAYGARPWRFGAEAYREHDPDGVEQALEGTPATSFWDPALAQAMHERGLAIPEEAVAAKLLHDLRK
jgi:uncharacterized protein (TIGR02679 family)